jgi:hypothetical protein
MRIRGLKGDVRPRSNTIREQQFEHNPGHMDGAWRC